MESFEVETRLRESVLPRFAVPEQPSSQASPWLAPDWVDLRDDVHAKEQVIQCLEDLSYLPVAWNGEDADLRQALLAFEAEASQYFSYFSETVDAQEVARTPKESSDLAAAVALSNPFKMGFSRLRMLQALTSFDGGIRMLGMPVGGEISLRSRVLKYRLRVLNFIEDDKDEADSRTRAAFDESCSKGLRKIFSLLVQGEGSVFDKRRTLGIVNLLGDAAKLSRRFCERCPFEVLYATSARRSGKGLKRDLRLARRHAIQRSPAAKKQVVEAYNLLGMELLQILLWMDGYYEGAIDMIWGPKSREAFEQALRQEGLKSGRLLKFDKGYWKIEYRKFIEHVLKDEGSKDVYAQQDQLLEAYEAAIEQSPEIQNWGDLEARVATRNEAVRAKSSRRRYLGIGSFKRALGKLIRLVRKGVGQLVTWLKAMVGPVLQFTRFIGRGLQRALRFASLALKRLRYMVSGQPFYSETLDPPCCILTKPDLDGDTMSFSLGPVTRELFAEHHLEIQRMNRNLGVVVSIAVEVIKAAASGPLGWMALARRIFQIVRDGLENAKVAKIRWKSKEERIQKWVHYEGAMLWS